MEAAERDSQLKVFAFEVDYSGKRQFVCCHPLTLWSFYEHLTKRHYYEVIPGNKPCKLFFDLEYSLLLNPGLNSAVIIEKFRLKLEQELNEIFGPKLMDLIDLDSTSATKFSRHLIVTSHVFRDINQMKHFVKRFCEKLRQDVSFPKVVLNEGESGLFVDEGVYTRNRNFRLYLSSKFGKTTSLQVTSDGCLDGKSVFLHSLVSYVVLNQEDILEYHCQSDSVKAVPQHLPRFASHQNSIFPEIDDFVTTLVQDLEERRTGYIRKCTQVGSVLSYDIAGSYKFCHNIGRHHKSNNIRIIVDLSKGVFHQTCHDCKDYW